MKIATFNINGVVRRLDNLLAWLAASRPDVACLQELKAEQGTFPAQALRDAGYHAVWRGQRSWNGVAILARTPPILTRQALPGDAAEAPARYIEAAVNGVLIGCLYAPNGNPRPGPKFAAKLEWMARLNAHAGTLLASGAPVALLGDYNVVPTDADIYRTRSWKDDALLQPEPRAAFAALLAQGWQDALAATRPWTFWDYKRGAWARDAGLRIDHILLSPNLLLRDTGVDRAVRGEINASDHAPAWADVATARGARHIMLSLEPVPRRT